MVGYVVFAAIVLFQSDIRRALAHLGRAPFFRYLAKGETVDETVEEIAVAAQMLSSQRTGAIVVVERQIGLRNYSEGGIPLDAQISYDLLVTIFQAGIAAPRRRGDHPGEPHLGRGLLPAPHGEPAPQQGPRHQAPCRDRSHRENDALASVVSEETGWISLVLDGRDRTQHHSRAPARPACASCSGRAASPKDPSRPAGPRCDDARQDSSGTSGLKVLSIALATLVWGLVAGQREAERSLRVPLEYRNIPDQLELLGEPVSLVDVRLRGTSGALGQLRGTDLVAVIDLHRRSPRPAALPPAPDDVVVPTGVTVLQAVAGDAVADLRDVRRQDRARCARHRRRAGTRGTRWRTSPPIRRPWKCRPDVRP
jgi:hypothetical protein